MEAADTAIWVLANKMKIMDDKKWKVLQQPNKKRFFKIHVQMYSQLGLYLKNWVLLQVKSFFVISVSFCSSKITYQSAADHWSSY